MDVTNLKMVGRPNEEKTVERVRNSVGGTYLVR
jgi:hypothetical protein